MRIKTALRIAATCSLLCAVGCDDSDDKDEVSQNPSLGQDASTGGNDASTAGNDASSADAGMPADTGTTADAGSSADTGASADATLPTDAQADATGLLASSSGPWVVYTNPYGDAGGANPAERIQGSATARAVDGGMQISLSVSGLPAARGFGSHLHLLACDMNSAGGHFQHTPAASADAAVTDPAFANPSNEVWLDFTTDDAGTALSSASVSWVPPDGGAKAIIVHDRLTGDGGVAGPKLACLPFAF
jgi:Cu-Zn family superoxide dismutase